MNSSEGEGTCVGSSADDSTNGAADGAVGDCNKLKRRGGSFEEDHDHRENQRLRLQRKSSEGSAEEEEDVGRSGNERINDDKDDSDDEEEDEGVFSERTPCRSRMYLGNNDKGNGEKDLHLLPEDTNRRDLEACFAFLNNNNERSDAKLDKTLQLRGHLDRVEDEIIELFCAFFRQNTSPVDGVVLISTTESQPGNPKLSSLLNGMKAATSSKIRYVSLYGAGIQTLDAWQIVRAFLDGNEYLETLELCANLLETADCAQTVMDGINACRNLKHVDFSRCDLDDAGLQIFLDCLFDNGCSLTSLEASHNERVSANSLAALNRLITTTSISDSGPVVEGLSLILSGNPGLFSDETVAEEFARVLQRRTCIKRLSFETCGLSSKIQVEALRALEQNTTIKFLDLAQNVDCERSDMEKLRNQFYKSLPRFRGLETLPFSARFFDKVPKRRKDSERERFLEALSRNTLLLHVNYSDWDFIVNSRFNFDRTLGAGTVDMVKCLLTRNRRLLNVQSFFDPERPVDLADRHVNMLPIALQLIGGHRKNNNASGVAAVYKLVHGARYLLKGQFAC